MIPSPSPSTTPAPQDQSDQDQAQDPNTNPARLSAELTLLHSIYPTELTYSLVRSELTFKASPPDIDTSTTTTTRANTFTLRIPPTYPTSGLPTILSAHAGKEKQDVSARLREEVKGLEEGVEVLDEIIARFLALVNDIDVLPNDARTDATTPSSITSGPTSTSTSKPDPPITTLIYLHHLLSTTKRKAILAAPAPIRGLSKPGYPGVLVFAGPEGVVRAFVRELRGMRWAAFGVRAELVGEGWGFVHCKDGEGDGGGIEGEVRKDGKGVISSEGNGGKGKGEGGVREVETMAEVVAGIVGERERGVFLEVMKVR